MGINYLLPPAYEVRGKVLFSQVSVCSHFRGGGRGYPIQLMEGGGVVIPGGRLPHPRFRQGVPCSRSVGYPIPGPGGGTPFQVEVVGRYPIPGPGREVPPPPIKRQSSIASTCYTAGSMPFAFTQDNFLVSI